MKPMKTKRILPISLPGALLVLALVTPFVFTACNTESDKIDITMKSDYSKIVEAINDVNTTLSQKLTLIESAVSDGFADSKALQEMILKALESLSGTTSEQFAAIETAIKSQTASLETKLAFIEAAITKGFADEKAQQALIKTAIESLAGPIEERLKAIETAIQSESLGLGTKLDLISSVIESKLTDSRETLGLIRLAIESLDGKLEEKLATLETVVKSQTTSLETKLAAIEAAVASGFADAKTGQELVQEAIESLSGTAEERLAAIEEAIKGQTTSLETKLGLIEAAVTSGLTDANAGQKLIQQAIERIGGDMDGQLASLRAAIESQTISLEKKLELIETAVKNNSTDNETGFELIKQAIESLGGTMEEKIAAIDKAIQSQTISLEGKLDLINGALNAGFSDATTTLGQIKTAILGLKDSVDDDELIRKIDEIVSKLSTIDTTINDNVTKTLTDILGAIKGLKDYSEILTAIQKALEDLIPKPPVITIDEEYMENDEVMMLTEQSLPIAYAVTSEPDAVVTVTTSDDISATVVPDANDPQKGVILIVSGKSITDGKTKVEITASNKGASVKRTLSIKEAYLKPLEPITQITETINVAFDCTTLELKYKSNMETSKPEVPDSLSNEAVPWLEVLSYNKTDETTTIQVKLQPNLGLSYRETSVTVKDTRFHQAALEFIIKQEYDDKIIDFEDRDLYNKIREAVDINDDFKICNAEAKMVKSLNELFGDELTQGASYKFFNEFQYFTGIETIPAGSFKGWWNLKSITLPESITTIQGGYGDEDGPFVECERLENISGKFATNDGKALIYNGILLKVREDIATYSIPESVQVVGSKAFYKSMITNVSFPTSLKTIRDHAFEYSKIYAVNFPTDPDNGTAYVDSIAENSFVHCLYLQKFDGPTNGTVRVTPDNLGLYQGTTLLAFAWGSTLKSNESPVTTWSIPDNLGIKKLAKGVFDMEGASSGSYLLRKLGLPSTLTYICKGAFQYLQNVSDDNNKFSIYFKGGDPPATVEKDAFMNVTQKTVYLYVPAVLNSDDSLNTDATNERTTLYLVMMGMGYDFFITEYYTDWPF